MRISVCMATYQGERFIEEQLSCIWRQTQQADEVIICDDASTDKTVEIIQSFIEEKKLGETWHLEVNRKRRGYPGNFYYAMSKCSGELVFLADQDDTWTSNKVEMMSEYMDQHKQVNLLSSKWGIIDANGSEVRSFLKPKVKHTANVAPVNMDNILYRYEWHGMTMCYRNSYFEELIPMMSEIDAPNDLVMAIMAADGNSFYCMDKRFQMHRRHEVNTAKQEHRIGKLLNRKRKLEEIEDYIQDLDGILSIQVLMKKHLNKIQNKRELMKKRCYLLEKRQVLAILINYFKNIGKIRIATLFCDLIVALRKD